VGFFSGPDQELWIPNHMGYRFVDLSPLKNPKQLQIKSSDEKGLLKNLKERIVYLFLESLDEKNDEEKTIDCQQLESEEKLMKLLFLTLLLLIRD
jgi:hypothetical protein